jgi:hypothetical protein
MALAGLASSAGYLANWKPDVYRRIFSRKASSAKCRGVARPCSHSCNVRGEIFNRIAALD